MIEDLPQTIAAVATVIGLAWRYLPGAESIKSNINRDQGTPLWP